MEEQLFENELGITGLSSFTWFISLYSSTNETKVMEAMDFF